MRKAAVHAVEAQEMRISLDGAEVVDRHHLDVGTSGFDDRAQDVAPDAPETIDRHLHRHRPFSFKILLWPYPRDRSSGKTRQGRIRHRLRCDVEVLVDRLVGTALAKAG